jgi:hypothetical protein
MTRPVDAVVTGFTKNAALCQVSLAPLLQLKVEGVIRNIHYVTWDGPELDGYVSHATMDGVSVTRVPQPAVTGGANQKSVLYQVANLDAALAQVAEPDALIVKSRPDFIYSVDFLRAKIEGFDTYSAIDRNAMAFGTRLPDPPLVRKIWLPWADAGQPFFYEDGAFIGLKRDVAKLVTSDVGSIFAPIANPGDCGSISHVVRFAPVFLDSFPIFKRYLAEYSVFQNDPDYRVALARLLMDDPFYWHLITAHAWVLHSAFHVDCGAQNDLMFYPNTRNAGADWSSIRSLRLGNPYDAVTGWRNATLNGAAMFAMMARPYARVLDDAWQSRMFSEGFPDFPQHMLQQFPRNIALYATGLLNGFEDAFYAKLRHFHQEWLAAPVLIMN